MIEFVKVPTCLFRASTKDIRLYCVYLDFKAFNPEGYIKKFLRREERHYYTYWRNRLISRGWARKEAKGFSLKAYQEVWRSLGVDPGWIKRLRRYKLNYKKVMIDRLPIPRKEYTQTLQGIIFKRIAGNKARQIKWRLAQKQLPNTETFMSCRAVGRLFGLKSSASGHKYRAKVFSVIPEPTKIIKTDFGYRYQCKKIAL